MSTCKHGVELFMDCRECDDDKKAEAELAAPVGFAVPAEPNPITPTAVCNHEWFEGRCVHCDLMASNYQRSLQATPTANTKEIAERYGSQLKNSRAPALIASAITEALAAKERELAELKNTLDRASNVHKALEEIIGMECLPSQMPRFISECLTAERERVEKLETILKQLLKVHHDLGGRALTPLARNRFTEIKQALAPEK